MSHSENITHVIVALSSRSQQYKIIKKWAYLYSHYDKWLSFSFNFPLIVLNPLVNADRL